MEKRVQIETAEDACEHLRLADSGREINFGHRGGGTEKMVGHARGGFFRSSENEIGHRTLERTERRTVQMMNNDRHARAPGGEAAEDAGFAAVRVDEVRLLRAENFFQRPQRQKILQRMHGADQFGNDDEIIFRRRCGCWRAKHVGRRVFEGTFRSDRGAGN